MAPTDIPFEGGATPLVLAALVGMAGIVVWHAIPSRRANSSGVAWITGADRHTRREARHEAGGWPDVRQPDRDRHALDDTHEIACRVICGDQAERRAAPRREAVDDTTNLVVPEPVDGDTHRGAFTIVYSRSIWARSRAASACESTACAA